MSWKICLALSFWALVVPAVVLAGDIQHADPLVVPRGPLPAVDPNLTLLERVETAQAELRERGFDELPLLAWGLLQSEGEDTSAVDIARAVTLAPATPAIRFEAARRLKKPTELARAFASLFRSAPGVLWLLLTMMGVLGAGLIGAAVVHVAVASFRVVPLYGHRFGHLMREQDPPTWPGVLVVITCLSLLTWLGLGPALVLGAAGMVACIGLRLEESGYLAATLFVLGLVVGPGIDRWSQISAFPTHDPALSAAWRVDHAQPLPGDREQLEAAVESDPSDFFMNVALANAWKSEGELTRMEATLSRIPSTAPPLLRARANNLVGMARLARGDVDPAIRAFEAARSTDESAAILYNLSQAYGRALQLSDQSENFKEARRLDEDLIKEYTTSESPSLHRYLIDTPIPVREYLRRAQRYRPETEGLARDLRGIFLGSGVPGFAWVALPAMGLLGLALRSKNIGRCARCERPVCSRCVPTASQRVTCTRCGRLFVRGEQSDPRVRRQQMELDRRRQWRVGITLAGVGLVLPGLIRLYEGRAASGTFRSFLAATGLALLLVAHQSPLPTGYALPAPFEVGGLGVTLPFALACLILVPLYLATLSDSVRRFNTARYAR